MADPAAEIEALRDKLDEAVGALEDLCSWDTPLTQDKWDTARETLVRIAAGTDASPINGE
jgi:hypothetical protein